MVLQLTKNTSHHCENLISWIQFAEFVSDMTGLVWCEKTYRNIVGDLGLEFWVSGFFQGTSKHECKRFVTYVLVGYC
jgi:hypothetical protein